MLVRFAVKNYRGFSQRLEWNLSNPSNYEYNNYAIKDGVIKNAIVYGPNGSGKTNLGMALFDIVNHLTQKFKKAGYYNNFVYAGTPNALVEFEYIFKFDEQSVEYTYSKTRDGRLANESLVVDGKIVFERKGRSFAIDETAFSMDTNVKKGLTENANHVSIVNFLLTSYPLSKSHYLIKIRDFVDGMLWFRNLDIREFIGLETNVYVLDEYIIKKKLVEDFQYFLDAVSGQKFKFVTPEKNDKVLMCRYGNEKIPFDVIASTGTHALMLLYFWIQKMGEASLVFIDEFDAFYHFELSYEVCKRLFSLDCQVFTSSHNTYLMNNDLLRPDCNFILQDNKIKALCDCTQKELRFAQKKKKIYRGKGFQV